jgi:DNA (cytosine-5)-methyltransferase 1
LLVGIRNDIMEASSILNPGADEEDAVKCGFLPVGEPSECPDLVDLLGDLVDPKIGNVLENAGYPKGKFETKKYPSKAKTTAQKVMRISLPEHDGHENQVLTEHEYSKHAPRIVSKFKYMLANNGEIPEEAKTKKFSQRVLKARWGNSGPMITATSMPDDYVHFSQPRTLTVREWARLQLFPDWYTFKGKRTTGGIRRAGNPREGIFDREVPKYTQIGNAVPVGLAERVGKHFKLILRDALGSASKE